MRAMETGLRLIPFDNWAAKAIDELIQDSEFYAEYDSTYGFFFFPEKEENYDSLELELDRLLSSLDVDYRIEGVF
jgi:hypothetical protein